MTGTLRTTITMDAILTFLDSMALSTQNKQWLGEHLIEQARGEQTEKATERERAHIMQGLDAAFHDARLAKEGKLKGRPLAELLG